MSEIEVHQVGKRYRLSSTGMPRTLQTLPERTSRIEQWALRDVDLSVARGETVGLIGRNGSGKSTLLRVLAGITRPTCGRVVVRGRVHGLLSLGEGLHPLLSGEENAFTTAILAGLTRREARRRLPDIAAFAELEEHMDQPLRTFSAGMRLRLAFSAAIHANPEILLIDEILSVGDLRFQEKCFVYLQQLQSSGVTIVLASHELAQILRLSQRAVWMADGQVRHIGEAAEVVERYEQAMNEGVPAREPWPEGGSRHGTGEVEVVKVRILDGDGMETNVIGGTGPMTVEIDFMAHQAVPDAIFGVSAHALSDGVRAFDLNTRADGHVVGSLEGPGTIRLHLDRMNLEGGSYRLDVGIYEAKWAFPYDYLWQAFPLEVQPRERPGRQGPPHRWALE
ncbi:MAG TPA: ABC transporter ATP-binding protein [Acidimicrobiales bacterium]|nr:ABC transporter ATP-binding protein [Acidimicrobiales bacterium]